MIYPNFLHPFFSNFTAVNKGSAQHFKDHMFTHSPSRQNVNSRLGALAFVKDSMTMLLRSKAAHQSKCHLCVQRQYQVHLLIWLIFQLRLKHCCARNTTHTGRSPSCPIGIYYQRYANFTLIYLFFLSKALTFTICKFCTAKIKCILLFWNSLAWQAQEKKFKKRLANT